MSAGSKRRRNAKAVDEQRLVSLLLSVPGDMRLFWLRGQTTSKLTNIFRAVKHSDNLELDSVVSQVMKERLRDLTIRLKKLELK